MDRQRDQAAQLEWNLYSDTIAMNFSLTISIPNWRHFQSVLNGGNVYLCAKMIKEMKLNWKSDWPKTMKIFFVYRKTKHLSRSKPIDRIGAVRKHRFCSAGCWRITIREWLCSGGVGTAEHQHTFSGRLWEKLVTTWEGISHQSLTNYSYLLAFSTLFTMIWWVYWDPD